MSRINQLRNILGLYKQKSTHGCIYQNLRMCSNRRDNCADKISDYIGQTSVLVQQGCDIQEVPAIVRRLKGIELTAAVLNESEVNVQSIYVHSSAYTDATTDEIIEYLDNAGASSGILSLVHALPYEQLTAEVAAHAFNRLFKYETLIGLQNLEHSSPAFDVMIHSILEKADSRLILDFVQVLKEYPDLKINKRFSDELLMRNADSMLSIVEICECIRVFTDCNQQNAAEKLWTGIEANEKDINDLNIKFIYEILPKLKVTQRLVVGILERRILTLWWNLKTTAVTSSLKALSDIGLCPNRTVHAFARWLNTNIHAISESELEVIISAYTKLDFSNTEVEKSLERYIKAKGVKIKSQSFLTAALKHAKKFRLRNNHILNGSIEFFIATHDKVTPNLLKALLLAICYLNFQSINEKNHQFWTIAEVYLKNHFLEIKPHDMIEILINCCYVKQFPIKFTTAVFNTFYLDKLHNSLQSDMLMKSRNDLKLLDSTLTLEADKYSGPLLSKDQATKSITQDGRIIRTANDIEVLISDGGKKYYTKNVTIEKLPVNDLYIVDILVHPSTNLDTNWSHNINNDRNAYVAILIHLPEHYDSTGKFLIGPQAMRIRHLRILGLKVVSIKYEKINELRGHSIQLENYLEECMQNNLPAFDEKKE